MNEHLKIPDDDQSLSRKSTTNLLWQVSLLALIVPLICFFLVWLYFYLADSPMSKRDWRDAALYTWIGTLVALTLFLLRNRRPFLPFDARENSKVIAEKWELRKSRKIFLDFFYTAFVAPLVGLGLAIAYLQFESGGLTRREIKVTLVTLLLIEAILLLRLAYRSYRARIVYKSKHSLQK